MRKKLIASRGESSQPYEVTIDDQPPLEGMNLAQSFDTPDDDKQDVPEEVKLAVTEGDIDRAKSLLEKAGYSVEVHEVGEAPAQDNA